MFKLALFPIAWTLVLASSDTFLPFRDSSRSRCPADKNEEWTYRGDNGPKNWGDKHEQCNGDNQSPIDIYTDDVVKDENLAQLALNGYDVPVRKASIENNGHTIELKPDDGEERTISVNGETYTLHQLHFHWGRKFRKGSEHSIDGNRYDMEMHLVHMTYDQKIAVVGIFFQCQEEDNEALKLIVDQLSNLKYKNSEVQIGSDLILNDLLPANPTSFYRYDGSLTTPGCGEGVTWSVVPQPMNIGKAQMAEFRKLYSATQEDATWGCRLSGNYRPVQPLNERKVSLSQ